MIPFDVVDIAPVIAWLGEIPLDTWPQQRLDEFRPAMVTDPDWYGFGEIVAPIIEELMEHFPGHVPFQQMLSVVMPGHRIEAHRDSQASYWLCRVHVPLTSNDRAWFITGSERHNLKPGLAYEINTRAEHAVVNDGETPRVHFMFDVRRP